MESVNNILICRYSDRTTQTTRAISLMQLTLRISIVLSWPKRIETHIIAVAIIFNEIQRMSILCSVSCQSKGGNTIINMCHWACILQSICSWSRLWAPTVVQLQYGFLAKMVFALHIRILTSSFQEGSFARNYDDLSHALFFYMLRYNIVHVTD